MEINRRPGRRRRGSTALPKLVQLYELADGVAVGLPLSEHVQADWLVFDFSDAGKVKTFLTSCLGSAHELLIAGAVVKLRSVSDDDGSEALKDWAHFSEEIRTRNRYFPQTVPDRNVLERVLLEHVGLIQEDVELFRCRPAHPDVTMTAEDMGRATTQQVAWRSCKPFRYSLSIPRLQQGDLYR